jgi:hypothetical protein
MRILYPTVLHSLWSGVLLEKLTGFQLVKKFSAFYRTRKFITAFTSARHLSLSWASSVQSIFPHPTSWRSILILTSHLRLGLPSSLKVSIQVRGKCSWYEKKNQFLRWGIVNTSPNTPSWRNTPCRLPATAYSIYSQLPSTWEAVPPSAIWGRALPWWQGLTYHTAVTYFI